MEELEEERKMMKFELLMKLFFQLFTYTKIVVFSSRESWNLWWLAAVLRVELREQTERKTIKWIFCVFYFLWKLWMRQRRRRLAREINKGSKGVCKQTSHGKTFIWGKQTHTLHPAAAAAAMTTSEKWKKIFVKKIITCSQHMHFNSYSFHFVTKNIYIIKRSWNESDIFTVNFTYTELTTRWGE